MFRAIIMPIFKNTRQCVTASGIMHPRCCRPRAGDKVKRMNPGYSVSSLQNYIACFPFVDRNFRRYS